MSSTVSTLASRNTKQCCNCWCCPHQPNPSFLPFPYCAHQSNHPTYIPSQNYPHQPNNPTYIPSQYYSHDKPINPAYLPSHNNPDQRPNNSTSSTGTPQRPPHKVTPSAVPEYPAIAAEDSVPEFSVLVTMQAPPLIDDSDDTDRASINLVLVLDVSGSMSGLKLDLVKSSVKFMIDELGQFDQLAIVIFSDSAETRFPMKKMSNNNRREVIDIVDKLETLGGTNIASGLRKGVEVLKNLTEKNPVSSIMFLSDGQDGAATAQLDSIFPKGQGQQETKVHSFGFGSDHDRAVMTAIASATGGTYSIVESVDRIKEAFARCLGGLLTIIVRVDVTLSCISQLVSIKSISSGSYSNVIFQGNRVGVVYVKDLCADERKDFIVNLQVLPQTKADEKIALLDISCTNTDVATEQTVKVKDRIEISRPKVPASSVDKTVNLEVDQQKNRLMVAGAMQEAIKAADSGDIPKAKGFLNDRMLKLQSSPSAKVEDAFCLYLIDEIEEIIQKMENNEMYKNSGRPLLFACLSSHSGQKDTTICYGNGTAGETFVGHSFYSTRATKEMINRARNSDN